MCQGVPQSHRPRRVRCRDKRNFPECYHRGDLFCPVACPRNCYANCSSCQASCTPPPPPPPPPPPRPVKPHKVKCHDLNFRRTCNQALLCPAACPRTCVVDCTTCQPVCSLPVYNHPPPPPSPVVVTPSSPPPPLTNSTLPATATPPPPDSSEAAAGRRVRCRNRSYPSCYYREHRCPATCPTTCEVDCVTCSPVCNCNRPGAVCQDPRFIGADGITFYFHGQKDKDFCIVSDTNLHINAHLIGKRNHDMGRDFTWVQSLGILFRTHKILIGAKKTATWDDTIDRLIVSYDGTSILLPEQEGAKWESNSSPNNVVITRSRDTNAVMVEVEGNFQIKASVVPITEKESRVHNYGITSEDCFAHLDLGFKFYSLSDDVSGVLGQTYAKDYVSRVKMGVDMPVLGGNVEFATSGIFSTDCAVARFKGMESVDSNDFGYTSLRCESGLDGRGVVCKR
ncbi:late embryogenesis abundant protein-related / LEA protein-related [Striga hermonthica]|uniref:Late embryogenesis abundant protein-related / LEA protein-related n=1 Tax=Striga hermonthica TaxID=68872 RepID=A0A9N7R4E5_STRHE|nr:late embryogenesis abundant protein-related / LEA protein-related [Striga hermonthica]